MIAVRETLIHSSEREELRTPFNGGERVGRRNVFLSKQEVISFQSSQSLGKCFLFV